MAPADDVDVGVRPGEVLAGKYRVERVLAVGGMGVVVAAHHIHLDTKVALKFMLPSMLSRQEAVTRFAREARAAVKITSEHVARVLDVGTLDSGAPYMVMEYLDGEDLSDWIRDRGALPMKQAIEFILQVCIAVADAHALGIVHRDLKPANLFCVRRSDGQLTIKVLDFGISKMNDAAGFAVATRTSALIGSPFYMSPEQMRSSKDVDARTDIWSLGVILYELLAGRAPFLGESVTELAIKVASDPVPPLRTFRSEVPEGLELVVLKCLEKERERRYSNVAELALALTPFASKRGKASAERVSGIIHSGLSASTLPERQQPHPVPQVRSSGTLPAVGQTLGWTPESRRKAVLVAAGAATVVIGVAAGCAALYFRMVQHLPVEPPVVAAQTAGPASVASASRIELSAIPAADAQEVNASQVVHPPGAPSQRAPSETMPAARAARADPSSRAPAGSPNPTSRGTLPQLPGAASDPAGPDRPEATDPGAVARAFDPSAAREALAKASDAVVHCRSPDAPDVVPTVSARVKVTFSPSGAATRWELDAPLKGTSLGACVVGALRAVAVPPFDGDPVIVVKSFTFQ
jgi:serine/threonine-protein kinase